jgi:hypothetical protein
MKSNQFYSGNHAAPPRELTPEKHESAPPVGGQWTGTWSPSRSKGQKDKRFDNLQYGTLAPHATGGKGKKHKHKQQHGNKQHKANASPFDPGRKTKQKRNGHLDQRRKF